MNRYLPLFRLLFTAVISLLLVTGCAERAQYQALPSDAVVLAFGDSVTAGVGAGGGEAYPDQLAQLTGLEIINAGISGDTARQARQRLAPLLAHHQPDVVIVELGGNDFLRKTPPGRVKSYLGEIVREARSTGAAVLLVAVPRFSLLRASVGALSDSPIYAELAEEEGVILVPDIFSQVLSDEALKADEIHPNAKGYRQLAAGIHAALIDHALLSN